MKIRTPQIYLDHESQFLSLQREHLGAQYTWPRIAKATMPEVLPLTTRTYDFYFLRGLPISDQDAAIMCYAITTWSQLLQRLKEAAQTRYMLHITLHESDRKIRETLYPHILYVPEPDKHFSPDRLRPPVSEFSEYVHGICSRLLDPLGMILLEADDPEEPPNVDLIIDHRVDGGKHRMRLDYRSDGQQSGADSQ